MPSIEDVLGKIKVPVRSVAICLRGDLQAEHDDLTARLDFLNREALGNNSLSGGGERREVAQRIHDLEAEMRDAEITFKFRGLGKNTLKRITDRFPAPEGSNMAWDVEAGAGALLAASAVEPTMTEAQADELLEQESRGHADQMVGAAWLASTGSTTVPFSVRASELIAGSGSN